MIHFHTYQYPKYMLCRISKSLIIRKTYVHFSTINIGKAVFVDSCELVWSFAGALNTAIVTMDGE